MKAIIINIAIMLYAFISMLILGAAILWLIPVSSGDLPAWSCAVIYPLAILVAGSSEYCMTWLDYKHSEITNK